MSRVIITECAKDKDLDAQVMRFAQIIKTGKEVYFIMDKILKTVKTTAVVLLVFTVLLAGCGNSTKKEAAQEKQETETVQEAPAGYGVDSIAPENLHHAEITVRDYGKITVALDAGAAPVTVENFMKLAKEGFYDGLTFHRIIDGFMIQGGDPNGNGTGGSEETVVGEFASNGHENPISHVKGVISMARAMDPDSGSSQFFITVADSTFLDGEYAAFGFVTDGMDTADRIAREAEPTDSNGTIPAEAQPVIESIVITD